MENNFLSQTLQNALKALGGVSRGTSFVNLRTLVVSPQSQPEPPETSETVHNVQNSTLNSSAVGTHYQGRGVFTTQSGLLGLLLLGMLLVF